MIPSIQVPDFAGTIMRGRLAQQQGELSRLQMMAQEAAAADADAFRTALREVGPGLGSAVPEERRAALTRMANAGVMGAQFALPMMQRDQERAEDMALRRQQLALSGRTQPTEFDRLLAAAGIQPGSPEAQALARTRLMPQGPAAMSVAPGATLVDPRTGTPIFTAPERAQQPTALTQRIDEMVANGVPRPIASGIATGALQVRQDPVDGTITVFDVASGQPFAGAAPRQPQPTPTAAAPPGEVGSTLPTDANYRGATGLPGLAANTANLVADLFGGRLPAPQVATAEQALRNLDTRTRMFLQSAIPGRPSNYLMEMIGGLTVSPATITLGPERASERIGQTTRFLQQTVDEMDQIASGRGQGRFNRQDIGDANRVLVSLRPLLADYQALETAFNRAPPQTAAPQRRPQPGVIPRNPAAARPPEEIRTPGGVTLRPIQ